MSTSLRVVEVYTDGGCIGNPGPGGYGVVLSYNGHRKELSAGYRRTTNNRMEILAAIVALQSLKEPCLVRLHADSEYVVRAMNEGWPQRWRANGWMRTKKERAANPDLWARLLSAVEPHTVEWIWVRGHAGNRENERCDQLAVQASRARSLNVDEGYEHPERTGSTDLFETSSAAP